MKNNKQQSSVEWFIDQLIEHRIIIVDKTTYQVKYKHEILLEQAKEMEEEKLDVAYGNGYEQGEMDFYKKMQGKGNQYADGYAEGYKRAMELTQWAISNLVPSQKESK